MTIADLSYLTDVVEADGIVGGGGWRPWYHGYPIKIKIFFKYFDKDCYKSCDDDDKDYCED